MNVTTNSVMCSLCAEIKRLGIHSEQGQHYETAFVDGDVKQCKTAKVLLKKIDKHRDSNSHKKCVELLEVKASNTISESIQAARTKFEERHKDNIDATAKVFRTAYECAQSHLPFREHPRLMELQSLNGVNCDTMLYSFNSCANIIHHIANQMCDEIVQHVVKTKAKFSILIDESTSVANVQSVVVYIRTQYSDEICTYFLGLLPLDSATASGIESTLTNFLISKGFSDDVMREQFIGFVAMVLVV